MTITIAHSWRCEWCGAGRKVSSPDIALRALHSHISQKHPERAAPAAPNDARDVYAVRGARVPLDEMGEDDQP